MLFMGTFFICLFIFMMQFLWKYVDEMVGKGLEMNVLAQFFFYSASDAGAGLHCLWLFCWQLLSLLAILESGLNCLP